MCDVVENSPRLHMNSIGSDLGVVDAMKEKREGLQENKSGHNPVYPVHLLRAILLQYEDPEASG